MAAKNISKSVYTGTVFCVTDLIHDNPDTQYAQEIVTASRVASRFFKLTFEAYVHVAIVPGYVVASNVSDGSGFAAYGPGSATIVVAGLRPPELTYADWLHGMRLAIFHEFAHHRQWIDGEFDTLTLEELEANAEEAAASCLASCTTKGS